MLEKELDIQYADYLREVRLRYGTETCTMSVEMFHKLKRAIEDENDKLWRQCIKSLADASR
jgi:hypothetical protein